MRDLVGRGANGFDRPSLGLRQVAQGEAGGTEVKGDLVVGQTQGDRRLEPYPRLAVALHPVEDAAEVFVGVGMRGVGVERLPRTHQRRLVLPALGQQRGHREPRLGALSAP